MGVLRIRGGKMNDKNMTALVSAFVRCYNASNV